MCGGYCAIEDLEFMPRTDEAYTPAPRESSLFFILCVSCFAGRVLCGSRGAGALQAPKSTGVI